jgi:hypothetical protein
MKRLAAIALQALLLLGQPSLSTQAVELQQARL